jgi:hypothetical protein
MRRFLKLKRSSYGREVDSILFLLPDMKKCAKMLWAETAEEKVWLRWWHFLLAMTAFALTFENAPRGPSGNTH